MPRAKNISETEQVSQYIQKLDTPLATMVKALRKIILSVDKKIGEQIKWGTPCFYYTGTMKPFKPKEHKRDIVVVTVHRGYPLLVFPSGAKLEDTSSFLEGAYSDGRRIAIIQDKNNIKAKTKELKNVIRKWLTQVDR